MPPAFAPEKNWGSWLYFTPTAAISIDINPSIELEVNRFGRVLSVTGYNDDGRVLADSLPIKHLGYADAAEQVQDMTMRQIMDRIAQLDPGAAIAPPDGEGHGKPGSAGQGNGNGNGNGTGNGHGKRRGRSAE